MSVEIQASRGQDDRVIVQELAAAVEAYRVSTGLSVAKIAERVGMSQQELDKFLRFSRDPDYNPKAQTMMDIARAIGLRLVLAPKDPEA